MEAWETLRYFESTEADLALKEFITDCLLKSVLEEEAMVDL